MILQIPVTTGNNFDGSAKQIASRCEKFPHHMSEYVKIYTWVGCN